MATEDIAVVGLAMQTDGVEKGIKALDTLASAGPKVEKAMDGIEKAASKTGKTLGTLGQGNGAGLEQVTTKATTAAAGVQKITTAATEADNSLKKAGASAGGAAAGIDKMGISAKQTAAALRGVPAQFTDIVTALQGGQAPMTVLLQQGGQLKDMFGGAVPAVKAIGGYIVGLISPLTVGAAAAGVLGYAMYSASQDAKTLKDAVVLTNGAVGVSADQLLGMSRNVGVNTEALNAFARSGAVSAQNIEGITRAAVKFESIGGAAIADTVKAFEQLKKSPVEASIALNEHTNYLTASLYAQIKVLDEQGRHMEAVNLAQGSYSSALSKMGAEADKNLGSVAKWWAEVKKGAEAATDSAKNFVGVTPLDARATAAAQKAVAAQAAYDFAVRQQTKFGPDGADTAYLASLKKVVDDATAAYNKLAKARQADTEEAKKNSDANELAAAKRAWIDQLSANRPNLVSTTGLLSRKDTEALAAYNRGVAANASPAEIQSQVGLVLQKYDTGASIEAVKRAEDAKLQIIAQAQDKVNALRATGALTEIGQITATTEQTIKAIDVRRNALIAERAIVAGRQDSEREVIALDTQIAALAGERTTVQLKGLSDVTVAWYKQKQAIEAVREAMRQDDSNALVAEHQRLSAIELQLARSFEDTAFSLKAANEQMLLEIGLVGKSDQAKSIAIEKLRIQLDLEKKIVELTSRTDYKTAADREKAIAKARAQAATAAAQAETNITVQYWLGAVNEIQSSLTDAIVNGFENGKSAITNFRDALVNEFKNLVLRPYISGIMAPVAQGVAGAFGITRGISQASGIASSASSISSLFGAGTYLSQFGSGFSGSASAASAMMGGAQLTTAAQIGSAAATVAPYLLAAIAVKSLTDYKIDAKGSALTATIGGAGTQSVGTRADFTQTGGLFGGGTTQNSTWGVADKSVSDYINTSVTAITAANRKYGDALGLTSESINAFTKNIEVSITGLDAAGQKAAIDAELVKFAAEQSASAYAGAVASFAKNGETTSITIARLAGDLTGVNTAFGALGFKLYDVSVAGAAMASGLVDAMGGLQNFQTQTTSYFQSYYTAEEQRAQAIKNINAATIGSTLDAATATRDSFRGLVEAQDLTTDSGRKTYAALMGVADAFASITPAAASAASAVTGSYGGMGVSATPGGLALGGPGWTVDNAGNIIGTVQNNGMGGPVQSTSSAPEDPSWLRTLANLWTGGTPDTTSKGPPDNAAALEADKALADAATEAARALQGFQSALGDLTDTNIDLQAKMLAAQGDAVGAYALTRAKDLSKITAGFTPEQATQLTAQYDANKTLADQIDVLTKSQSEAAKATADAATAADHLKSAWAGITETMLKEVDRIRGVVAASSTDSLAALQSRFAIATAQARAGDQTAAGNLAGYGGQLSDSISVNAGSRAELIRMQAQVAQSLQDTAVVLGAPMAPILQPPVINTDKLEASIASLSAEIVSLKGQLSAIQSNTNRTATATETLVDLQP